MLTRTLILALSLTAAAPALAAEAPSAEVHIADLDLSTAKDQQRLETRVKSAARNLCRTGGRTLADRAREIECVTETMASAKPQSERAIASAQSGTQLALLMLGNVR